MTIDIPEYFTGPQESVRLSGRRGRCIDRRARSIGSRFISTVPTVIAMPPMPPSWHPRRGMAARRVSMPASPMTPIAVRGRGRIGESTAVATKDGDSQSSVRAALGFGWSSVIMGRLSSQLWREAAGVLHRPSSSYQDSVGGLDPRR